MKIAYFYFNNLEIEAASTKQTLNTLSALRKSVKVDFYCPFIIDSKLKNILSFFQINQKTPINALLTPLLCDNLLIEKITRLLLCLQALMIAWIRQYDFVYVREISFFYFLSFIPKSIRPKAKLIIEMHKIYHLTSEKVSVEAEKKALSVADAYVTVSQGIKMDLNSRYGIGFEKIKVIPNAVEVKRSRFIGKKNWLKEKYGLKNNDLVVVYIGSFDGWKGVKTLIRSRLYINNPQVKLLLISGQGGKSSQITQIVKKLKLKDKVMIDHLVFHRKVMQILSESMIGVVPNNNTLIESRKYTSPMKLFEYLEAGLPMVCSKVPSIAELVKENQNCLFFKPGDAKDLAEKITRLLNNKKLMVKMKLNNRKLAKKYSWDIRAKRIVNFLNRQ